MSQIAAPNLDDPKIIAQELYKRNLELHKERKRTAELLYRVSEAIYATDATCKITLFNHTLEKLLGKNSDDVLGQDISEVMILTDEKGNKLDITAYCRIDVEKVDVPNLAVLKTPFGDRYVHIKISVIETDAGSNEYLVTMSDVTKEKELEKTKDEFISITSHELRTPMSIVKSYLWMLQSGKGGALAEKQKEYVEKAVRGTERMIALINDMLSVSRIEQGRIEIKKEKTDIRKYLEEVLEEFEIKVKEKDIYLKTEVQANVGHVFVDQQKLREIVVNLVGNSMKFTDNGGITVKFQGPNDGFYKLSIVDTGRGIEKKELKLLFHKFQRLDNSYRKVAESSGTGLGLYIVKLYANSMGGHVGVESAGLDKGSTFWVTIPAATKSK